MTGIEIGYNSETEAFSFPDRKMYSEEEAMEIAVQVLAELEVGLLFSDYQEIAERTAVYPREGYLAGVPAGVIYTGLGICGEGGEVGEKIKKALREDADHYLPQLKDELGDVLWYWAMLCEELDLDAGDVAQRNVEKLTDRHERGAITGQGDNR